MRIYHFLLDPRVGGPHVYVASIIKALAGEIEAHIVTAGRGPLTGIALFNFRHMWRPLYLLEIPCNVLLLLWSAAIHRIVIPGSIFHVHGAANIAPIIAAWILSVPIVWHLHETVDGFRPLVMVGFWAVAKLPHRLVVVTNRIANFYGLGNCEVIPAPIDLSYWRRDGTKPSTADGERLFRIVAVGNLNPIKGHDVLLEAFEHLHAPWELRIVGARLTTHSRYADRLKCQADWICEQKHQCSVKFLGWLERDAIKRLLSECDVFVLSSRSEACPIALLEAMAMECVCIATEVGGVQEIVGSHEAGLIVAPESSEQLYSALVKVQGMSWADKCAFGAAARVQLDKGGYSLEIVAGRHRRLYDELSHEGG